MSTRPAWSASSLTATSPAAHSAFGRAAKIGERFRGRELLTFARMGVGRCLIYLGEIAEGLALLDEAMVSVEASEIPPMAVGDAYCTAIDACSELFDVHRCDSGPLVHAVVRRSGGLVLYRGHCLLHRAELLMLHGGWSDAVTVAQEACPRLAEPINPLTLGGAHYVEAELHRLRGEFSMAERPINAQTPRGANRSRDGVATAGAGARRRRRRATATTARRNRPDPSAGPASCVPRPRS